MYSTLARDGADSGCTLPASATLASPASRCPPNSAGLPTKERAQPARTPRPLPPAGLSGADGGLRPHRLESACSNMSGKRNYTEFFTKLRDLLTDDGVGGPAFHRRDSTPRRRSTFRKEVHLSRGRHSIAVRDYARRRTHGPVLHRHRDSAAALRRDAAAMARSVCRPPGRSRRDLRRALCRMLGALSDHLRNGLPLREPDGVPDAADEIPRCGAALTRDYMFEWERAQAAKERRYDLAA